MHLSLSTGGDEANGGRVARIQVPLGSEEAHVVCCIAQSIKEDEDVSRCTRAQSYLGPTHVKANSPTSPIDWLVAAFALTQFNRC